jgi:crossover junction endodeoxyribonuclease RusA
MSKIIRLQLDFPPSVNHYLGERIVGSGKKKFVQKYPTTRAKAYRQHVCAVIAERWPNLKPIERPVSVLFAVTYPDHRRRDLDNYWKVPKDALTHAGFWADDCLVHDERAVLIGAERPGGIEVFVRLCGPADWKTAITEFADPGP